MEKRRAYHRIIERKVQAILFASGDSKNQYFQHPPGSTAQLVYWRNAPRAGTSSLASFHLILQSTAIKLAFIMR